MATQVPWQTRLLSHDNESSDDCSPELVAIVCFKLSPLNQPLHQILALAADHNWDQFWQGMFDYG